MVKKRDQEIVEVISNNDFTRDLFRALAYAVIARGGTMQHLRRIVNEKDLQNQIADLVVTAKDSPKFSALVVYAIPAMDELKRRFPAYVNPSFGQDITFEPIKVCENISRETREVEFEYVHLDRDASNDEVLAEIDKRGLRPALPEELFAFNATYPEEMTKFPIVALGSGADVCGHCNVAYLWCTDPGRSLDLNYVDFGWHDHYRFLAVRKEEKLAA